MAGGNDLNLLKSWNPKLSKNRQKVKQKEEELLLEETKIQQRQKEREIEDLSSTKSKNGLEWMYEEIKINTKTVPEQPKSKPKPKLVKHDSTTEGIPQITTEDGKPIVKKKYSYSEDDPMNKYKIAKKMKGSKK